MEPNTILDKPKLKDSLLNGIFSWLVALVICIIALSLIGFRFDPRLVCWAIGGPVIFVPVFGRNAISEYWLLIISLLAFSAFQRLPFPIPIILCSLWTAIGIGFYLLAAAAGAFS